MKEKIPAPRGFSKAEKYQTGTAEINQSALELCKITGSELLAVEVTIRNQATFGCFLFGVIASFLLDQVVFDASGAFGGIE